MMAPRWLHLLAATLSILVLIVCAFISSFQPFDLLEETQSKTPRSRNKPVQNPLERQSCLKPPPHGKNETSPPPAVGICSLLPKGATASSLWRNRAEEIIEASMHPLDVNRVYWNLTQKLFRLLTPDVLERGYRSPVNHFEFQSILELVDNIQKNGRKQPLQVAVFGGSIVEGRNCEKISKRLQRELSGPMPKTILGNLCSWPFRLQHFLKQFTGNQTQVHIFNMAVGGTSTPIAMPVLQYGIYQDEPLRQRGPDVVVNAYSTNDNVAWHRNKTETWEYYYERENDIVQYVAAVNSRARPCGNQTLPLVVHVDDYIGNQHNIILGGGLLHESTQLQMDWIDKAYISYADAVRSFVYAQTREDLFSSPLWYKTIDGHFLMTGHIVQMWVIAYSLLKATVDFCEDQRVPAHSKLMDPTQTLQLIDSRELPPTWNKIQGNEDNLSLNNVSQQWRDGVAKAGSWRRRQCADHSGYQNPCVFAMSCSRVGTVASALAIDGYIKMFKSGGNKPGWIGHSDTNDGWQQKLGLVAFGTGSWLELQLKHVAQDIKVISVHYLKSYGEKWSNSTAKIDTLVERKNGNRFRDSFILEGFHPQESSIAYSYQHDLRDENQVLVGDTLTLNLTLIGGSTFKLLGLFMCSR